MGWPFTSFGEGLAPTYHLGLMNEAVVNGAASDGDGYVMHFAGVEHCRGGCSPITRAEEIPEGFGSGL